MAEYYPLLAKAVGSLPNSTPESRRVVYERARKALIGQLRTLHPPVPDDDIERESNELDRAVERLEGELASGRVPTPIAPPQPATPQPAAPPPIKPLRPAPPRLQPAAPAAGLPARPASVPPEPPGGKPAVLLRPRTADVRTADVRTADVRTADGSTPAPNAADPKEPATPPAAPAGEGRMIDAGGGAAPPAPTDVVSLPSADGSARPRPDGQRPFAPQPPAAEGSRRRLWIIPVGIGLIVVAVALAAYKLRDTRQSVVKAKPAEQTAGNDSGKIAERVGSPSPDATNAVPTNRPAGTPAPTRDAARETAPPANPEVPVAQRAALLVEAPDEPNKVKTFLGSVVWKLNNVNAGPGDGVGLAVEADIDLPDDKMKAVITFEKNTDASLPASHTIKVRFTMQPGSVSGDVQQISVPQLRQEDSPSGEALAGVTVPVVQNSFLVGLSPGNAETVNIKQLKDMAWIDVPMLLASGKIAKLTFEKGTPGERDLGEAITAWQKS